MIRGPDSGYSITWDTEGLQFHTPTSWDEGEETAKESNEEALRRPQTDRTSAGELESEDSLPELVSDDTETEADDSGYMFLNTPPSTGEEDTSTEEEEREKKKQAMYRKIDRRNEEARMEELTMEQILDIEDGNYKPPTPCIGLTCPLAGEQYFIDPKAK